MARPDTPARPDTALTSFAEIEGREYIFVSAGAVGDNTNTIPHIQDAVNIYNRVGAAIEEKMNNGSEG